MNYHLGPENPFPAAPDDCLSAIHIDTTNIKGSIWAELDTPEDYEICRELFGDSEMARKRFAAI